MKSELIETNRLVLRLFEDSDLDAFASINADETVMRYFPSIMTRNETKQFMSAIMRHYDEHGFGLYAVELKANNEFIGFVGLNCVGFKIPHYKPLIKPAVEIGWRLKASAWGNGYATEAANAVLPYAFVKLKLKELVSFTAAINLPSRRVMEKIGLKYLLDFNHPKLKEGDRLQKHVLYHFSL